MRKKDVFSPTGKDYIKYIAFLNAQHSFPDTIAIYFLNYFPFSTLCEERGKEYIHKLTKHCKFKTVEQCTYFKTKPKSTTNDF